MGIDIIEGLGASQVLLDKVHQPTKIFLHFSLPTLSSSIAIALGVDM